MMIAEVCAHLKNYFCHYGKDLHTGDFSISGGQLSPALDLPTDYIRIVGSHRNDGVHCLSDDSDVLVDEPSFHGAVWIMSPPPDFLALVAEIEDWQAKYGGADSQAMSPYTSESFGGYSYSKPSGHSYANGGSDGGSGWQSAFANRLNPYRRIRLP